MHFPREILDHIATYLIEYERVGSVEHLTVETLRWGASRPRLQDQWDDFVSSNCDPLAIRRSEPVGIFPHDIAIPSFTYPKYHNLFTARLISRAWYASASAVLSRDVWWPAGFESGLELERAARSAHLVKKLNMGEISHVRSFKRGYDYAAPRPISEMDNLLAIYEDRPHNLINEFIEPRDGEVFRMHYDRSTQEGLMRKVINGMKQGKGLDVSFPYALSDYDAGIMGTAGCYDLEGLSTAMETISYALRSPAFQHLVSLRVGVPSTFHVGQLAASLSLSVKEQLKDLFLRIVDATGPGGSRYYHLESSVDDPMFDEDGEEVEDPEQNGPSRYQDGTLTDVDESNYPPGNVQLLYPNRQHQDAVWDFIRSCKNLESLGLQCSHYLDLERLKWRPGPRSRGLRALHLHRVYATDKTLIRLLIPRENHVPAIRRVEFSEVKIPKDGGEWMQVYMNLICVCSNLQFFKADNIGYLSSHPLFRSNDRLAESNFSRPLWSTSEQDNLHQKIIQSEIESKLRKWL